MQVAKTMRILDEVPSKSVPPDIAHLIELIEEGNRALALD
jgi:hypothetical protein